MGKVGGFLYKASANSILGQAFRDRDGRGGVHYGKEIGKRGKGVGKFLKKLNYFVDLF